MEVSLPVWKIEVPTSGEMEQIFMTNEIGYSIFPVRHFVEGGSVKVKLLPYSAVVLRYKELKN